MRSERNQTGGQAARQLIIDRLRFILAICGTGAAAFAVRELFEPAHVLGALFAARVLGIGLALAGFLVLRSAWTVRCARPLSIAIIAFAYAVTAAAGVVSPTQEYVTTAVLFVGAALTTATLIPWGFRAQAVSVACGAAALAAAVLWRDGDLGALATDPGAAVALGFVFSTVTAREFSRYRRAHRRELLDRMRAEGRVRRLNAQLEQRVAERTMSLQTVNDRLAAEIAERQRANDALRASEALLADTVDNSTAIVALKSVSGRYLLVNREFERRFARRRAEVVGRLDAELFPAPLADDLRARDDEVLRGGGPLSFEQELTLGETTNSYVCAKFPLHDADGALYGVGSMATDISVLKQLQEELRRHQDELAHVLRLHTIGEMAAALAHEINQPLCAITNYAQGGVQRLRSGDVDPAALLYAFEQVAAEGLRAGQILRGIRGLVRRESGLEMAVDVNALAGEALRVLAPQARFHGVTVRLEGAADIPQVCVNPTQIEQVMVNLMLNGMQAVAGQGETRREVVVATTCSGDTVEVAVSDTGEGIASTVASKLFMPFVTTKARGLGLGLAISRTIVENHGGRLWAAPQHGPGTTFRFSLPVAAARTLGDHTPAG